MHIYLFISAHRDDFELSSSGTASRLVREGNKVYVIYVADKTEANKPSPLRKELRKGSEDVARILGTYHISLNMEDEKLFGVNFVHLINKLESHIIGIGPDVIITHSPSEYNQDHVAVSKATEIAIRDKSISLLHFEVPSVSENSFDTFKPNTFVGLTEEDMLNKKSTLACYPSEMSSKRGWKQVKRYAKFRGLFTNCKYAEAFKTIRNYY